MARICWGSQLFHLVRVWGGAVEEGEFLTGGWGVGKIWVGCRRLNLLYARCAKNLWHVLPTFHWYILKPNVWERLHHKFKRFLIYIKSQKKETKRFPVPDSTSQLRFLNHHEDFSRFFLRGGIPDIFFGEEFKIQKNKLIFKRIPRIPHDVDSYCIHFWKETPPSVFQIIMVSKFSISQIHSGKQTLAMENGPGLSRWLSYWTWGYSSQLIVYQRVGRVKLKSNPKSSHFQLPQVVCDFAVELVLWMS